MLDSKDKEIGVLRQSFLDISRGYSSFVLDNKTYFIKHLCFEDNISVDTFRNTVEEYCISKKIPTEEEKLEFLFRKKIWTKSNETELKEAKSYLTGLEKNRSNAYLPSQLAFHDKTIQETKNKVNELWMQRFFALDITKERFIEDRLNRFMVCISLYKDKSCQERSFGSIEEFEELDESELHAFLNSFNQCAINSGVSNIRKIIVSDFFSPYFIIYAENINNLFKLAVESGPLSLSYNQIHFIINYRHFKKILTEHTIPHEIRNNPDKIDEYITLSANMKQIADKSKDKGGYTGIMGSAADLKYFKNLEGIDAKDDKLMSTMKKKPISGIMEAAKLAGN